MEDFLPRFTCNNTVDALLSWVAYGRLILSIMAATDLRDPEPHHIRLIERYVSLAEASWSEFERWREAEQLGMVEIPDLTDLVSVTEAVLNLSEDLNSPSIQQQMSTLGEILDREIVAVFVVDPSGTVNNPSH